MEIYRFSDRKIISILKENEDAATFPDLCRGSDTVNSVIELAAEASMNYRDWKGDATNVSTSWVSGAIKSMPVIIQPI